MAKLPLTRIPADAEKQSKIRASVRTAKTLGNLGRLALIEDTEELTGLLADPRVSAPIYTLPETITRDTVTEFIERHLNERERGEGLLMMGFDELGQARGYYDIQIWPQWAACELGGALHPDRQNTGQGSTGAAAAFGWLFDEIGVDLICETAALNNVRTARLLERLGFTEMGEIQSKLPNGEKRASRYWELNKSDWQAMR